MPKFLVVYGSDIHGNIRQYTKLFDYAIKYKANAVVIGGDIAPKDGKNRTILGQRKFLKSLIPIIKNAKKNGISTYIIMGNDDFKSNEYILKDCDRKGILHYLDGNSIPLNSRFNIVGYPYVSPTPFIYKDWEKQDLAAVESRDFIINGIVSRGDKLVKSKLRMDGKDTIQKDLKNIEINKNTLFVCHSPPYNSSLDIIHSGQHVGSVAVRNIIEKRRPILSLHGHIHETVYMSGKFKEKLGNTLSVTSGNDFTSKIVSLIVIDLYNLKKIKRITV